MNPAAQDPAYSLFVGGLAWLAAAALIGQGRNSRGWRSPRAWLCLTAAAAGLANWLEIADARLGSLSPTLGMGVALLWGAGTVALIEYALRRFKRPPRWMPQRWAYAALALWTLLAIGRLDRAWLPTGYQVVFAWGLLALAARSAVTPSSRPNRWRFLGLAALAGYGVAVCLHSPATSAALALLALASFWRDRRAPCHQATSAVRAGGRALPAWRRWVAPAAFVVALGAGWLVFGMGGWQRWEDSFAEAPAVEISNEQLFAALEGDMAAANADESDQRLKRCGLAVAPIAGLVLAVWGLSRLPFAR